MLVTPIAKFEVQLLSRPIPLKNWSDLKDDPHRECWYSSIMERYAKNCLPPNSNVLPVVSTFNIKPTSVEKLRFLLSTLWEWIENETLERFWSIPLTNRIIQIYSYYDLALLAGLGLTIYELNVDNAFKCTLKIDSSSNPPVLITIPPLYMHWFNKYFPIVKIPCSGPYVLQYMKFIWGPQPAGWAFYHLIKAILGDAGIKPTSINAGFYVFVY